MERVLLDLFSVLLARACGKPGYPAHYTKVSYFKPWIMDVINSKYLSIVPNASITFKEQYFLIVDIGV